MEITRRTKATTLAVFALIWVAAGYAINAKASSTPIQIHAVRSPSYFSWHNTLIYKYQLISKADYPIYVQIAYNPYVEFPDGSAPQKGGPPVWYYQHYQLAPREIRKITFRVFSPTAPLVGENENFCVYAAVQAKSLGLQGAVTCALPNGK